MMPDTPVPRPPGGVPPLRVPRFLVVDDDRTNRMVLRAMLARAGYAVIEAETGEQAVALFEQEAPDLVVMDVMMPGMDGYEATRQIKELAGSRFVPVIFLTALTDEEALAKCIAVGGDDFLSKPFGQVLLQAKIDSLLRARDTYKTLSEQRDELRKHQEHLQQEQAIAQKLFRTFMRPSQLEADNLRHLLSPMSLFNGDVLLLANAPSGGMHVMLGDFTGHGLPAAVGALPAAETFYGMTAKGFSLSDIALEINDKLRLLLPTGLFCAAALVAFDSDFRLLSVWNGGMPELLLASRARGLHTRVPSSHVPLGILERGQFDATLARYEVAPDDYLYLYSDGLTEALDEREEMFGSHRLADCFSRCPDHAGPGFFDAIEQALATFRGGVDQRDDLTLIELACRPPRAVPLASTDTPVVHGTPTGGWRLSFALEADAMRRIDPLPLLIQAMTDIEGLRAHRERLFTILAELYSNALEHGLLGLDSGLKSTPPGFTDYYRQRDQRLQALEDALIVFDLENLPLVHGGRLVIRITDSGPGFDLARMERGLEENTGYQGRGIPLVRNLCESLRFRGRNNIAEVTYVWS